MDRYDAFISYSHAADGRLAPAVQSGLQRLARKVFQRRALRVFRDETGLSTNPHLWGSIETAIDASDWFVLLASPESSRSDWVNREVATWLERKPLDHLLVVVTDGVLAFTPDGPVDADTTTCLPAPLLTALDSEPRWLDLRWARDDTQLDLRNGRFRAAIADLAAPIHGIPKDDLESDDVRQQKRARRLAVTGVAAVGLLAVTATAAAVIATDQRDQAQTERRRADDEADRAVARGVAAQATALAGERTDLSLLLAAEAFRRDPSIDSEAGLVAAFESARQITELGTALPIDVAEMEVSPDRSALFVLQFDGELTRHDPVTFDQVGDPLAVGLADPWSLDISADGTRIAVGHGGGATVIDTASGDPVAEPFGPPDETQTVGLNADGTRVLLNGQSSGLVQVIDVDSGEVLGEVGFGTASAAFLTDDLIIVQGLGDTSAFTFSIDPDGLVEEGEVPDLPQGGGMALSPDGSILLVGGLEGTAVLLDAATFEFRSQVLQVPGSRTGDFFFDETGSMAGMSSDDGAALVVDTTTGLVIDTFDGMSGSIVTEFLDDGRMISASFSEGGSTVWVLGGRPALAASQAIEGFVANLLVIDDGASIVASIDSELSSDLVVASPDGLAEPSTRRTFRGGIRAIDVDDDTGIVVVYVVDFTADELLGRRIHVVGLDDLADVTVIDLSDDPDAAEGVENISLAPDGSLLAVGYRSGRLGVIDVASGSPVIDPIDVDDFPCCLATLVWTPDGTRLFTGGQDGTLRTWDTSDWTMLDERVLADGQFALRRSELTADGSALIVPSESGEVFLVDVASVEPIGAPFAVAGTQFQRATIVRDGTRLAVQGRDGKLRLWDVATRRQIGPPLSTNDSYSQIVEALDDDTVISGNESGAFTWNLDPATWVDQACELAGRNLTLAEWDTYVGGEYASTCSQWPAGT